MSRKKAPFLTRLEWKIGRFGISNLMLFITSGMAVVFLANMVVSTMTDVSLFSYLWFDRAAILRGEVWRVFTFLFLPPSDQFFWALIGIYFYYLIGRSLEQKWGSFRFTLFYLVGVLGSIAAGLLTGYATNDFLNASLFLAFAIMFPNYELLIFFIIPVKVKWLALLDGVLYALMFISGSWSVRATIAVSLLNLLLFFLEMMLFIVIKSHV